MRIDDGHKAIDALARTYGQLNLADASEAETRFHVIDEILGAVLGWEKADITVEDRVVEGSTTTYADYVLRTASTALVVEAKRATASFVLPTRRRTLGLSGVLREGEIGVAIQQAREYCVGLSVPFAVITNGSAWIIFTAIRTDGITFEEGTAHIFRDLDDIKTRLIEFWELLSRERVMDGNLADVMLGRNVDASLEKRNLRSLLPEPGFRLGRNAVYEHIEPAVSAALSDEALLKSSEALGACYVRTAERTKFDSRLRMHLADVKPPLGQTATRVRTRKGSGALDDAVALAPTVPRFIVVLGPVGAGKTTFLHYTRRVSSADQIDGKIIWLVVDFKKATESDDPRDFIYRELLALIEADNDFELGSWETSIKKAYGDEIQSLRRGVLALLAKHDTVAFDIEVAKRVASEREAIEPFVDRVLRWSGGEWPTYLVIDNVDQLESGEHQRRIFLEAQAIARRIGCHIIMSMREATFLKHRQTPVFDAFQFDVMYVDPPAMPPVLSHRFAYAKRVLANTSADLRTDGGMSLRVPDLAVFFDVVSSSLLSTDTGFMFESLAGGDIRRGLTLVREFLQSGHTNADRALAAYLTDGDYQFPTHEVFRGAVLGQFRHYNDEHSLLPNIYDAGLGTKGLQLLRLRIVHGMVEQASAPGYDGTNVEKLRAAMHRMGVAAREFQATMADLHERRLIRTRDGLPFQMDSVVLPTRLAGYILRTLCQEFAYAEFCSLDTTIYDADVWESLRDITLDIDSLHHRADRVEARIERLRVFLDYLTQADQRWVVDAKRRSLEPVWTEEFVGPQVVPKLERSLERALKSAKKNYPRLRSARAESVSSGGERVNGNFTSAWPDKDYAFVKDADDVEWFCHKTDFRRAADWAARKRGAACSFAHGSWQGKPRAVDVTVP